MLKSLFLFLTALLVGAAPATADFISVPINGTIDGGIAAFVERALSEAETTNAEGIIFVIDTPGGRIDSAVEIKDAILGAQRTTVAFVDRNAISAGSLISIACDSIYMAPGASIGAATAIDLEGNKASEKVISYFRAQMRATAEARGRRPDIAEAMVDENIAIEGITTTGSLITLTYTEAEHLGYSNGTAESIDDVMRFLGRSGDTVVPVVTNWSENLVRIFTNPIVSSLLISIGLIGLLIEIKTPGWGLGGTIALIALGLFFGSHYLVNLAGIEELLLLVSGLVLLAVEIFIIPGFGIVGIGGILLILASFYLSLLGSMPRPKDLATALTTLGWAFVLTIVIGYVVIRLFPRTPLFRKLALLDIQTSESGYVSAASDRSIIGREGIALTNLRPAGTGKIDGVRYDMVTQGDYIAEGTRIVVTEVHGSRIVVQAKEQS